MYPRRELARIMAHKARRLEQIELQRRHCSAIVRRGAQPLIWIQKANVLRGMVWPLLPYVPFVAALGLFVPRGAFPRLRAMVAFARVGGLVLAAVQAVRNIPAPPRKLLIP